MIRSAAEFEALAAQWREPLRRHLARLVDDPHAVEDLLQEVFVRLYTRPAPDAEPALAAWLYQVATNVALNHLRTRRRRHPEPLDQDAVDEPGWLLPPVAPPDELVEREAGRELCRRLVDELPDDKREVVRLVYLAGLSLDQTADALGVPTGTVKSRLYHARQRLAHKWRELAGDPEDQP